MVRYNNRIGKSGVYAYEIGQNNIIVQFATGAMYEYNYSRTGSYHIENMKKLAIAGSGLNSYINTNVKYSYSRKIR